MMTVRQEYTSDYMIEKLQEWTPYTYRWLNNLPHKQLRALFAKEQSKVLYGITKDPANKPKARKPKAKKNDGVQMILDL